MVIIFGPASDLKFSVRKLDTELKLFELFTALYNVYDKIFILESLVGPKELSEMSIIGFDPDLTVNCTSDKFFVYDRNNRLIYKFKVKEPLSCLKKIVPMIKETRFRYAGGAVGYISYDAVRFWEHLPIKGKGQKH